MTHLTDIHSLAAHPAANIFPMMSGDEYAELVESIRSNGLREPIWLTTDGLVLDGRNRLKACQEAGVEPSFRTYAGDDPVKFVVDLNVHRRHLSETQRARVAASIANMGQGRPSDDKPANLPVFDGIPTPPSRLPPITQAEAAKMLNVSERSVRNAVKARNFGVTELDEAMAADKVSASAAAKIADLEPEEQRQVLADDDDVAIHSRLRDVEAQRRVKRLVEARNDQRKNTAALAARAVPMLDRKYAVIYADPPWRYDFVETESRAIENQYPTMTTEDIAKLEVPAADDAVLFMWATNPKLTDAFEVLKGWGFNYVTNMVWVKDKIGMGYYARQRHELLFIAKRGTPPVPEPTDRPDSVIQAPRGRHSAKPQEAYEVIERMYPGLPKIEMFCRTPREGWDAWGNEVA